MPLISMTVCKLRSLKKCLLSRLKCTLDNIIRKYYYCAECIENLNGFSNIISELVYLFE